jgi:hypothetical protein
MGQNKAVGSTIYVATTVNGREYVVFRDGVIIAGPFATAAEAVKAREELVKADPVVGPVAPRSI